MVWLLVVLRDEIGLPWLFAACNVALLIIGVCELMVRFFLAAWFLCPFLIVFDRTFFR